MLGTDRFWAAFGRAGLLVDAVYQPRSGAEVSLKVGFVQPDLDVLSGLAQTTQYQIEFQTADLLGVRIGDLLTVANVQYKVRSNPEKTGDGLFSKVMLVKP